MNERLEYIQRLEGQIRELEIALKKLKESRDSALEQAQHEELEHLEAHLNGAQIKFKDIHAAAEDAWQDLTVGLDNILKRINSRLQKLIKS